MRNLFLVVMNALIVQATVFSQEIEKKQASLTYDFSFAELAIQYLETGKTEYLYEISNFESATHIFNHALNFNDGMPTDSKLELVTYLLSPMDKQRELLPYFKKNLKFAKESLAETGIIEEITLNFLPENFTFSGSLFFTFGYDIGVAFGQNSSLNLAHPIFSNNMNEMKYWAIHELHHAGFIMLKGGYMPSLDMVTYKEMAHIIEYFTHLEGMGTYAPLGIREQENAMDTHQDYVAIQDLEFIKELEKEYFDIYFYFKNSPENLLTEEDWGKINILSDAKRLWYVVGAHIAQTIDQKIGREKLISLISEPSEKFITTYLKLKSAE